MLQIRLRKEDVDPTLTPLGLEAEDEDEDEDEDARTVEPAGGQPSIGKNN